MQLTALLVLVSVLPMLTAADAVSAQEQVDSRGPSVAMSPDGNRVVYAQRSRMRVIDWTRLTDGPQIESPVGTLLSGWWVDERTILAGVSCGLTPWHDLVGMYLIPAEELSADTPPVNLLSSRRASLSPLQALTDGTIIARSEAATERSFAELDSAGVRPLEIPVKSVVDVLFSVDGGAVALARSEESDTLWSRQLNQWRPIGNYPEKDLALEGWWNTSNVLVRRTSDAGDALFLLNLESESLEGPILGYQEGLREVRFRVQRSEPISIGVEPGKSVYLSSEFRHLMQGINLALPNRENRILSSSAYRHIVHSVSSNGKSEYFALDEKRANLRPLIVNFYATQSTVLPGSCEVPKAAQ